MILVIADDGVVGLEPHERIRELLDKAHARLQVDNAPRPVARASRKAHATRLMCVSPGLRASGGSQCLEKLDMLYVRKPSH